MKINILNLFKGSQCAKVLENFLRGKRENLFLFYAHTLPTTLQPVNICEVKNSFRLK